MRERENEKILGNSVTLTGAVGIPLSFCSSQMAGLPDSVHLAAATVCQAVLK